MATQTPSFSQTMSDPNFKAYVKEGVVSKLGGASSAANLATIAEVGKMGLDVQKSYAMSNLEKLQQGEIEDYMSKSPTRVQEVVQETQALQGIMGQLDQNTLIPLDEGQTMEEFDAKYSGVQAEHAKRLDYLKRASEQGVMTSEMFAERVIKNTREAVAKNPGLAKELMSSSQNVLELSGIQGRIAQDTKLATLQANQAAKLYSDVTEEMKQRNIVPPLLPSGELDLGKAQSIINTKRAEQSAYDTNLLANNQAKLTDEAEVRGLVNSGLVAGVFNHGIDKLEQNLSNLFADNTIDISKKIELANTLVVNAEQELSSSFIGKHMDVPAVKDGFSTFNRQATLLFNSIKDAKDGTTAAKALSNAKTMKQDEQTLNLLKKVDVASFNFISEASLKLGPAIFDTAEGTRLKMDIISLTNDLLKGMPLTGEEFKKDSSIKDGSSKIATTLKVAAEAAAEKKPDSVSAFNKIFNTTVSSIFDSKATPTAMDAFTRMEEVNTILKDPKLSEAWVNLDEDTRSKISSMVDNYNDQLAVSFANYIKDHPSENIKLNMLPDGTLSATGGSTTFNRDLLGRVNSGLKAYANLQGTTTDKVRDEFFVNYYGDAFADQATFLESRGAKNNITNVADSTTNRVKEFASLEEGVQYSQQKVLDIYKTNKRSVASIVNVLRPEDSRTNSFYMPQADYVKQIAKTMGVGEREILDLSKPYTMASLLSAVAQAEGKNLSVGRISDALTKPPLPASSQAYYNATRQAGEQRQQIYNGIAQFFRPVSTLVDKGLATVGGVVVDLATMPAQVAWDMDHYKKTGELKHKYETQGLTPNINKLVTQVIAPIESGSRQIDPKTNQIIESPKGALGITQVMPKTGRNPGYGVTPLPANATEAEYIKFSEGYFGAMLKLFKNDTSKALAAYNAGPGAVQDAVDLAGPAWLVALPRETKDYVLKARLREANLLGER